MLRKRSAIIAALFLVLSFFPVHAEMTDAVSDDESLLKTAGNEVNEQRSSSGKAYAVLTSDGDFIFFRSENEYADRSITEVVDLLGNTYNGVVFRVNEGAYNPMVDGIAPSWQKWVDGKNYNTEIKRVRVADGQSIKPLYTSMWFANCRNLTDVNLAGIDTSACETMSGMFERCVSLKKLNLNVLDTGKLQYLERTFIGCENLETLEIDQINTANVISFASAFAGCRSLKSLDVSNFNTSACINFGTMFDGCESLKELDVKDFVTANADQFAMMFRNCKNIRYLDLSNFDTNNAGLAEDGTPANSMRDMFANMYSLYDIHLGKNMKRWCASAALPSGIWDNRTLNLSLTSEELSTQYPANAEEWAGLWEKEPVDVTGVEFESDHYSFGCDTPFALKATVLPYDAENKKLIWSSDDENIATVDQNGIVTGHNLGTTNIHAVSEEGSFEAVCSVEVLFKDVADSSRYFFEPVYWAYENEITVGAGGHGKFSPGAFCTREQFVTFLWRLEGEPAVEKGCEFTDVPEDAWYYAPISWALEKGITTGLNDGTGRFGVGLACTREQCVTFLHRSCGSPEPEGSVEFTDSEEGRYYYKAIKWAASREITVGLNDGTGRFGVGQSCTRGMLVTFLYRFAHTENSES